tara:strand:+ start:1 stop:729 length:729 start_codon:yes stop_codon:yes gene_type:complete
MKFTVKLFIFFFLISLNNTSSRSNDLDLPNSLFDEGKFEESVKEAENLNSIDAKIFSARTLAIYGHFLLEGNEAIDVFLRARKYAYEALEIDKKNAAAHVEAAHSMGRYSQLIGIVTALKEGFAGRISFHLDEAIKIDPSNINAQIAKGSWHAEIVDKAGFMANILYGATSDQARAHYENAINLSNNEIGFLYEIAYGYALLGKKKDNIKAKALLLKIIALPPKNYLDKLYISKANDLLGEM